MHHAPNIHPPQAATIILGVGANVRGRWGSPDQTIGRCLEELTAAGLHIVCRSLVVTTRPLGFVRQAPFRNAVVCARGSIAPARLLRLLKQLERDAGRRRNVRWGPRPLDIDILDFGGRIYSPKAVHTSARGLILPHPELHRRQFVLGPLASIRPAWVHPRFGLSARQLEAALTRPRRLRNRQAA